MRSALKLRQATLATSIEVAAPSFHQNGSQHLSLAHDRRTMAQTASEKARSYEGAIQIIESRQRKARPTTASTNAGLGAVKQSSSSGTPGLRGAPSIEGMSDWLRALGYSVCSTSQQTCARAYALVAKGPLFTQHHPCSWDQRQRQHLCLCRIHSPFSRQSYKLPSKDGPVHLTASH